MMPKDRREFLRLAGVAWALVGSASLSRAAGPGHDTVVKSLPSRLDSMPMPLNSTKLPDADLVRRIKAISNVFEVGKPQPDYAYVEDLGDGRGYTVTQYGFCTYNNEVSQVINRYAAHAPDTPLKKLLPHLPPENWSGENLEEFPRLWRKEIRNSALLGQACDEQADALYFAPAVESANAVGVMSPIGLAIFYDTLLQHGAGTDPDSLSSILKRTLEENGDVESTSEAEFLRTFLAVRRSVLENATNRETRQVWKESVRRVDALGDLLEENPDLAPPIKVANADVRATVL